MKNIKTNIKNVINVFSFGVTCSFYGALEKKILYKTFSPSATLIVHLDVNLMRIVNAPCAIE